ncbi:MAG: hypothetical protein GXY64_07470 [Bacteroidales bacterium]|nr:hypothetical protein [Bacteroidales bacterium]
MYKKSFTLLMLFYIVSSVICKAEDFVLVENQQSQNIYVSEEDWKGVHRAAQDLKDDIFRVSRVNASLQLTNNAQSQGLKGVIIGTIGKSPLIDNMIKRGQLDVKAVKGQWESYVRTVVDGNLVIAGSDKRGTIYGIYDISQMIGVSPWYWMADATPQYQNRLVISGERYVQPSPKVKYRGIFINDEWPSFGTWCTQQFGGVNSKAYSHIFELLLRLKANYFWPAMWDSRFNEDDPLSPQIADEMGIVMGTSHHEPMMRAHKEYTSRRNEVGPWDYAKNPERINQFFTEGIEHAKNYENIITIGMRGDGDVAMGTGNDAENMQTLAKVKDSQRKIISKVTGKKASEVPQLWAIFTEVQRYYDAGFRVPDDVTLLLCDNNWGYIRRKGRDFERKRKGGLGLYYHIDMNGGPWNDRWINTTTVPKLREQLHQAYASGIDRIWIINVGDLKPKEMPIDFIMRYAWNPDAIQPGDEKAYLEQFAESIFGKEQAEEIADIISKYSKYNLWRKPEVQYPGIYNQKEIIKVNNLWDALMARTEAVKQQLPADLQDAFYQLVYYPVMGSAGVSKIYNCATVGDSLSIEALMKRDQQLTNYYNKEMAGGKWNGMMLDNHIGYTQWSIPNKNANPMSLGFRVNHNITPGATHEYSIPSYQFQKTTNGKDAKWIFLPDLGRGKGCMGIDNVMAMSDTTGNGATLEYEIELKGATTPQVAIGILPTQDVYPARGLRIGVQLDNQPMQILDARQGMRDEFGEYTKQNLAVSKVLKPLPPRGSLLLNGYMNGRRLPRREDVFDNLRWLDVNLSGSTPGKHTLRLIMIDPEVVVEQIVVNPDNNHYSYFGAGFSFE